MRLCSIVLGLVLGSAAVAAAQEGLGESVEDTDDVQPRQ